MTILPDLYTGNTVINHGWELNLSHWPVVDTDGTWLIFTETERRLLASGLYEYRALLDRMM